MGRLAKKFRWVLKRGWHVSGDSLWGNITFWSKMSRLLLMAHVEHATSNFLGQPNRQGCRVSVNRSEKFLFTSFAFWHFERKTSEPLGKNVRRIYQNRTLLAQTNFLRKICVKETIYTSIRLSLKPLWFFVGEIP